MKARPIDPRGGRKIIATNNLAVVWPDIARTWNYERNGDLKPDGVTPGSNRNVWWRCDEGHEWQATIVNRTTKQSGCPYCSGKRPTAANNLAVVWPDMARTWNYKRNGDLKPEDFLPASHKKVWWVCDDGHDWQATIGNRTINQTGCPYCSGKRPTAANNLAVIWPDIARTWNYERNGDLKPEDFLPASHKKVWWVCEDGHEWEARIGYRTRGQGCPFYCKDKRTPQP